MRKVLFITYYFPPAGGSAVQRILKFVKYLPLYGWQPVILTACRRNYVLLDESLESEVPPSIEVFRTPAPDLYRWYGKMGKKGAQGPPDLAAIAVDKGRKNNLLQKQALKIRSALFVPDARVGWMPGAVKKGLEIIRQKPVEALFTSAPPFTTVLAGGKISRLSGLPWISDYRDPWTQAYFYFKRPWLSRAWEEHLEKTHLRQADRIISINRRILDGLKEKYGILSESREAVIPNGYDPEDFEGLKPLGDKDHFTMVYTGTLNSKMHPLPLLKAVDRLCSEDRDFCERIRIRFIGRIGEDVMPMIRSAACRRSIEILPHMAHRECLRHTKGADLLLLLIPDTPGNELIVTGKLFEYMRSGKPILCLSEAGDAADIIRQTRTGFTAAFHDISAINRIIREAFQTWQRTGKGPDTGILWDKVDAYDRKKNTQILARILDEVSRDLKRNAS